jgi:hypothetical protein
LSEPSVAGTAVGAIVAAGSNVATGIEVAVGPGEAAAGEQAETKSETAKNVISNCKVNLKYFLVNILFSYLI